MFDCDIFFFPFYGEGMPISVLEAMAFSMPVITRNVGGIKDFFINGEMGFCTDSFYERKRRLASILLSLSPKIDQIFCPAGPIR